ncbi:hypothetical protein IV203_008499 [Nitzschia inconspicua]|uniref:Uncharacterized protein n=1 Tax=Nitzschia inconspicua TaxID=303405 RepID=A0A9K3PMR4_9STRA|nr:hypothetical protein IV203_008499 [Nitzschia inconspicua]
MPIEACSIIRLMWDHCYKEWNTRNKARHEKDTETRNLLCVMTRKGPWTFGHFLQPQDEVLPPSPTPVLLSNSGSLLEDHFRT